MCGRYTLAVEHEQLRLRFGFAPTDITTGPRYNVAPGQKMPVVVGGDERRLRLMRWGLVPSWSKEERIGYKMINARSETVHEKPSFKQALKERRCIVPADGYYEWKQIPGRKGKVPLRFILKDRRLFGFAGLWDRWKNPEGEPLETYTILTTDANELSRPVHHRMPVILHPDNEELWLDGQVTDPERLQKLFVPYDSAAMDVYEVSTFVNPPRNDTPQCIEPMNPAG